MLVGIPTSEELRAAGTDYLLMAFDAAMNTAAGIREYAAIDEEYAEPPVIELDWGGHDADQYSPPAISHLEAYEVHARRRLSVGAIHLQTAIEFLLKSMVVTVSPFLLLEGRKGWANSKPEIYFDDLKSVDAVDLPDVLDTVRNEKLSKDFRALFRRTRTRRNALLHAASTRLVPTVHELLIDVLIAGEELLGARCWPRLLRDRMNQPPGCWVDYHGLATNELIDDFDGLINELDAAECQKFLAFDKSAPRFLCPGCRSRTDVPSDVPTAMLVVDDSGEADCVHCIACDTKYLVEVHEGCSEGCVSIFGGRSEPTEPLRCLVCGTDLE